MEEIIRQLKENGYDYGIAFATKAEVENGAACGQLSIIVEEEDSSSCSLQNMVH